MTYRSHTVAPNRFFDHIYDPVYSTSNKGKDVAKQNCVALTRSAPIHVYPVFDSFFSELCRTRRNCYAYQKNILPYFPDIGDGDFKNKNVKVTGVDRPKFFANPISNVYTINVGLMATECYEKVTEQEVSKRRHISSQTIYRESEAQTSAFLPEAVLDDNAEVPEVLYVADLIQSDFYPGLREVEIIERSRKRRTWEVTSLPVLKTKEEIPKRVAAVEAFEWEQWMLREKEINECQQARLKIVSDLIAKREKENEEATNKKLENSRKRILEERRVKKNCLLHDYQRKMRFLANKQRSFKYKSDDVVLQHYDKKIDYALPKLRLDVITKKRSAIEYSNDFEERFNALHRESSALKDIDKIMKTKKQIWLPKEACREVERGVWNDTYLKKLYESLKQFRREQKKPTKKPKPILHQESLDSCASFPPAPIPDEKEEQLYQDTILIQRLIKGKAIRNMLQRGKDVYQELIDYIRSNNRIDVVKELFPDGFDQQSLEKERLLKEYKRIENLLKNDEKLQEDLKRLEGSQEHKKLRKLEEDLNRLQQERKQQALYLLAERERYEREATDLAKESQDQTDVNYENLKSQYDAISKYLENILLEGIDRVENPREYVRKFAKKIDREVSRSLDSESSTESDIEQTKRFGTTEKQIYTHLLKENIVPEMLDRIKADQFKAKQKAYLNEIHNSLYEIVESPTNEIEQLENICRDMVEEIIQNAFEYVHQEFSDLSSTPPKSSDSADYLATQIVESILNELTQGLDFSSNSYSESSKSPRSSISSSLRRSSDSLESRVSENPIDFDEIF